MAHFMQNAINRCLAANKGLSVSKLQSTKNLSRLDNRTITRVKISRVTKYGLWDRVILGWKGFTTLNKFMHGFFHVRR